MNDYYENIIKELKKQKESIDFHTANKLCNLIMTSNRIFCDGYGRSGLMIRAFANRLTHLGLNCNVIGEVTTLAANPKDLFIAVSGSGETRHVVFNLQKAHKIGLSTVLITASLDSKAGSIADYCVLIPGDTKRNKSTTSIQPMGSLFEQSTLLYCDALVLQLMKVKGISNADMIKKHANIE